MTQVCWSITLWERVFFISMGIAMLISGCSVLLLFCYREVGQWKREA